MNSDLLPTTWEPSTVPHLVFQHRLCLAPSHSLFFSYTGLFHAEPFSISGLSPAWNDVLALWMAVSFFPFMSQLKCHLLGGLILNILQKVDLQLSLLLSHHSISFIALIVICTCLHFYHLTPLLQYINSVITSAFSILFTRFKPQHLFNVWEHSECSTNSCWLCEWIFILRMTELRVLRR